MRLALQRIVQLARMCMCGTLRALTGQQHRRSRPMPRQWAKRGPQPLMLGPMQWREGKTRRCQYESQQPVCLPTEIASSQACTLGREVLRVIGGLRQSSRARAHQLQKGYRRELAKKACKREGLRRQTSLRMQLARWRDTRVPLSWLQRRAALVRRHAALPAERRAIRTRAGVVTRHRRRRHRWLWPVRCL